ncbi:Ribonuclease HI [Fructilactobacillus florum 8D]|uniref:Ribonuclease HI n=1 Tax=Fructilactobacillus florum 8D TaxID=1221538 RepID=W9EI24_9LACO|nr:ribonuclease HI family protein [Fructilactobacillus florum]ETO40650.1 Ribonuclease HI [Fructilactobacillus florum 8D]
MYFKLYSDGAYQPRNQQGAGGVIIVSQHQQKQLKTSFIATSNHTAEFQACIFAFTSLKQKLTTSERSSAIVTYYTDSRLVAESITKQYAKHYQPQVDQIIALQTEFKLVFNNWLPDSHNHGAHELAQQALHQVDQR